MTLEVAAGGRTHSIAVRPAARGFEVTLDGRPLTADLVATPGGWSLLLGEGVDRPMTSYEIAVDGRREALTVYVDGRAVPVTVAAHRGVGRSRRRAAAHAGGPQHIVAPMPGRIVKVLVTPGDVVAARQGLIVIEAMKMENELRAPGPGTVAEVRVAEGALVDANSVLIVIA